MLAESYSSEINPIYLWFGFAHGLLLPILMILSFLLLCIGKPKKTNSKITLIPCILCATASLAVFYVYAMELFVAYYSGAKYEMGALKFRLTGPYWWIYAYTLLGAFLPILFFFPLFRKSLWCILVISIISTTALHLEKFV